MPGAWRGCGYPTSFSSPLPPCSPSFSMVLKKHCPSRTTLDLRPRNPIRASRIICPVSVTASATRDHSACRWNLFSFLFSLLHDCREISTYFARIAQIARNHDVEFVLVHAWSFDVES